MAGSHNTTGTTGTKPPCGASFVAQKMPIREHAPRQQQSPFYAAPSQLVWVAVAIPNDTGHSQQLRHHRHQPARC